MKIILPLLALLSLSISCSGATKEKETAAPVTAPVVASSFSFSQPWNKNFKLHTTENGEVLSVGSLATDGDTLYVYDMAAGSLVKFDPSGKLLTAILLESIGRNTYAGDDFIVDKKHFIFLNTIDRRLERFSKTTGKHLASHQIPQDLLADAHKRSHRTLSRIFIDNGTLFLGNDHVVVPFDLSLGKRTAASKLSESGDQGRFLLYSTTAPVFCKDSLVKQSGKAPCTLRSTHYPVTGKRTFKKGNRLYALSAGKDSVTIRELK